MRAAAAAHFAAGDPEAGDACVGDALRRVTSQLEALAAEAEALRAYRAARLAAPTAGTDPAGCIVDAVGAVVCLTRDGADAAAAPSAADASDEASASAPATVSACTSGAEAAALLGQVERGERQLDAPALEAALVHAAHRHWWAAARTAVDALRASNAQVGDATRRSLTELRDESASVLALLRQTRMDEATISCAVMWAQGDLSVHLNVKFAARLDSPVTVRG